MDRCPSGRDGLAGDSARRRGRTRVPDGPGLSSAVRHHGLPEEVSEHVIFYLHLLVPCRLCMYALHAAVVVAVRVYTEYRAYILYPVRTIRRAQSVRKYKDH